jgi:hypothetical protein
MAVRLGVLGVVSLLLRAVAWTAILIALFGWRQFPIGALQPARFQFSILGLMCLTLAVAILCGLVRWLVALLGESAVYLLQWIDDIPLFACWLTGLGVALARWKRHPEVSLFAVLGIGLSLATAVLWQTIWMWLSYNGSVDVVGWLSIASILLSALGSVLVLCAALGWRHEPGYEPSPETKQALTAN